MRNKIILVLMFVLVLLALVGCPPPVVVDFFGFWLNEDSNTSSITQIVIQAVGDSVYIDVWGKCHPIDCYWGEMKTTVSDTVDGSISLSWVFDFAVKTQTLTLLTDGRLKVTTFTHFTDNSGRLDYESIDYFEKEIVL